MMILTPHFQVFENTAENVKNLNLIRLLVNDILIVKLILI